MSAQASEAIVVFITTANKDEAKRLAAALVDARLASCAQILPDIESVYRWNGEVRHEAETLMLVKTASAKFGELERQIRLLHSYKVPEILAVPVTAISQPYLSWLIEMLEPSSDLA